MHLVGVYKLHMKIRSLDGEKNNEITDVDDLTKKGCFNGIRQRTLADKYIAGNSLTED